jgi:hypothetical protein
MHASRCQACCRCGSVAAFSCVLLLRFWCCCRADAALSCRCCVVVQALCCMVRLWFSVLCCRAWCTCHSGAAIDVRVAVVVPAALLCRPHCALCLFVHVHGHLRARSFTCAVVRLVACRSAVLRCRFRTACGGPFRARLAESVPVSWRGERVRSGASVHAVRPRKGRPRRRRPDRCPAPNVGTSQRPRIDGKRPWLPRSAEWPALCSRSGKTVPGPPRGRLLHGASPWDGPLLTPSGR